MKRKILLTLLSVTLLLFLTIGAYASLIDVIPSDAFFVSEFGNLNNAIDFLYSGTLKTLTQGELDLVKAREETNKQLGFDALDPEFLKGMFSGGVAVSVTGLSIGGVPDIMFSLSPSNKMKFLEFLKALESKLNLKENVSTYKGVNIAEIALPKSDGPVSKIVWSIVANNLVIGDNSAVVKKAIEVSKGETSSIAKNADYVDLQGKIKVKLGALPYFIYFDVAKLGNILESLAGLVEDAKSKEALKNAATSLSSMNPIGLSGVSGNTGSKLYYTMKLPDKYKKAYENAIYPKFESLNIFPKNTFIYFGGLMPFGWNKVLDLMGPAAKKTMEDSLSQLKGQMGFDLEQMLLSWLANEVSIAIFDPSGMLPKLALLIGYSDKSKAQATADMVMGMLGPSLGGAPSDKTYEGVNYKAIESPMFPLGYTFLKNRLILASGVENLIDVTKGNMAPLSKNTEISNIIADSKVSSIFYLDVNTAISLVERLAGMGGGLPEEVKTSFENLKKVKDVLLWAGYKGDYSFGWIKINNVTQ